MLNALIVAGRVLGILSVILLAVLLWKTVEYFDRLPDKAKPIIAWDTVMLFLTLVYLVVRLVIA